MSGVFCSSFLLRPSPVKIRIRNIVVRRGFLSLFLRFFRPYISLSIIVFPSPFFAPFAPLFRLPSPSPHPFSVPLESYLLYVSINIYASFLCMSVCVAFRLPLSFPPSTFLLITRQLAGNHRPLFLLLRFLLSLHAPSSFSFSSLSFSFPSSPSPKR